MSITELPIAAACSTELAQDSTGTTPSELGVLALVELILKRRDRLDRLIRDATLQRQLVPQLLAIALGGFVLFGVAMALVLSASAAWPQLTALADVFRGTAHGPLSFGLSLSEESFWRRWLDGSAWALIFAYAFGLIAASGICLPTLYFYGLLAGVRLTMLDVVLHTLKSKATAAVALVGILPIYAAVALAIVIFPVSAVVREAALWLGLALPFIAGLWGTWSLYRGFLGLTDTLAETCRGRRTCFLRRLVLAWAACYSAVTPVLIFTIWQKLA